jgi:soluble lytic murein transglycosylase
VVGPGRAAWWLVGFAVAAGCFNRSSGQRGIAAGAPPLGEPLAAAIKNTDPTEASRLLDEAALRYPTLVDYTLYFQARSAARAGRIDDARAALARLSAEHPDSVWTGRAALLAGELARRAGDQPAARDWLVASRAILGRGDRWTRATVALAEVEYESGDAPAALELAYAARRAAPRGLAGRRARRLTDRIVAQRPDLLASPDAIAEEADLRVAEGDFAGARDAAADALGAGPSSAVRARALWARARAEKGLGRTSEAEATCVLIAREGDETLAPRALSTAARWYWNADEDDKALALYRDAVARFPHSPEAPEALYAVGRIQQEAGRYPGAARTYTEVADRFPRASVAGEARWRAAWVRYLAGDASAAEQAFARVASRTGHAPRIAAEYWRARTLARLDRNDEARALFTHVVERHPYSYYAGLAEQRLGLEAAPPTVPAAPVKPPFPPDVPPPHGDRARLLAEIGLPRFAKMELRAVQAPERRTMLVAYEAIDAPGAALRLAADAGARSTSGLRRYLYPLGYWDTVRAAADARGVDPLFVLSLIRQESLFDPDAVSGADAHGLMQLLPRTARDMAAAEGRPAPDRAALHDVGTNVQLGTTLLRRLLDRYDGSRVKALAAYNAGEDAVGKWERRYAGRPEDEFTEMISFRETRDYVKAVLRNYRTYTRLYAPSASDTSFGSPPNAPFDMMAMTSPGRADSTR